MLNFILVVSLLFALVVAVFAVQNNAPVEISFLGWTFPGTSLVIIIFGSAAAGAVSVFFLGLFKQIKMKMEIRQLKAENSNLKFELNKVQSEVQSEGEAEKEDQEKKGTDKSENNLQV